MSRVPALLLALSTLVFASAAHAQLTMPEIGSGPDLPLPSHIDREALEDLAHAIAPAVLPVRTFTDLGEYFRPRFAQGSGAATLTVLKTGEPPALITAFAHVATANRVEVRIGGEWVEVTLRYGTPMFDLVELIVPSESQAALDDLPALNLASRWSTGTAVFSPTDRTRETAPDVVIGLIDQAPADHPYYVRALVMQHNGYPIVSIGGDLLAITSILVGDRHGGSLAIPFGHIATWREEWPQLETPSPIGWEPRVRTVPLDIETGRQAVEP